MERQRVGISMRIEIFIYVYIAICVSLIAFNCVYVFIMRHSAEKLLKNSNKLSVKIWEQILRIDEGYTVSKRHKNYMYKKLKRTSNLTAFDNCINDIYSQYPEKVKNYLFEIYSVFMYLTVEYQGRDTIKAAYLPYIFSKYEILKYKEISFIADFLFNLLYSSDIYCRENALAALYSTGNCEYVADALKIIDNNKMFHHSKLICDGLFKFNGDKKELADKLWAEFETYSVQMQVNIMNFMRFAEIRNDKKMYEILADEKRNQELRFSAIRYFEKFYYGPACDVLHSFAENKENRTWEYQAIASSALKTYPCERSAQIIKNNLSSSNWYIRLNSAICCEKFGYSYTDLIQIFDGNDRYAREILQYRLDIREAKKGVAIG